MSGDDELRLAELLCARLAHDLASPVGAVSAGVELLAGEAADDPALALLSDSAAAVARRLRFLRAALGHGNPPGQAAALKGLVAEFLAVPAGGGAIALDWRDTGAAWDGASARLLLNLVLLACDALKRGGAIIVEARPGGSGRLAVVASGPGVATAEIAAALTAAPGVLTPRQVQAHYAARLAAAGGGRLAVSATEGGMRLCVEAATSKEMAHSF